LKATAPTPEIKKTRRGRGKGKMKKSGIKIFYNNINGYNTKKGSLEVIVKELDPDIIALCETKKAGRLKKDELQKYNVIDVPNQGKEGLLIGVRKGSFQSVREITDTDMKNIVTVRVVYPRMNLRIIMAHAPQDNAKLEERSEFFEELAVQVERAEASGDQIMVLGDFNARIENNSSVISATTGSPNGKELVEIVKKYQLNICNFHEKSTGKWTRIQHTKDGTSKSVLDYVLLQECLYHSVTKFVVDEEKIYTPYRQRTVKGKKRVTYTNEAAHN
jgi:exonuclease III